MLFVQVADGLRTCIWQWQRLDWLDRFPSRRHASWRLCLVSCSLPRVCAASAHSQSLLQLVLRAELRRDERHNRIGRSCRARALRLLCLLRAVHVRCCVIAPRFFDIFRVFAQGGLGVSDDVRLLDYELALLTHSLLRAHWCWNTEGWLYKLGLVDFAGSTVVHITVCACPGSTVKSCCVHSRRAAPLVCSRPFSSGRVCAASPTTPTTFSWQPSGIRCTSS